MILPKLEHIDSFFLNIYHAKYHQSYFSLRIYTDEQADIL
jgi:hypothetical protein